jgi:hypothetical protein
MINSKILGLRVAGSIFGIVGVLHLLRIITGVSVIIDGWLLPVWVNVIGLIGTTVLCVWFWLLSASRGK